MKERVGDKKQRLYRLKIPISTTIYVVNSKLPIYTYYIHNFKDPIQSTHTCFHSASGQDFAIITIYNPFISK